MGRIGLLVKVGSWEMRGSLRRGEIIEKSFITQEPGQVTKIIKLRNNLRMDEIWRVENERVERIGELKK